jgi:hypothetical protein
MNPGRGGGLVAGLGAPSASAVQWVDAPPRLFCAPARGCRSAAPQRLPNHCPMLPQRHQPSSVNRLNYSPSHNTHPHGARGHHILCRTMPHTTQLSTDSVRNYNRGFGMRVLPTSGGAKSLAGGRPLSWVFWHWASPMQPPCPRLQGSKHARPLPSATACAVSACRCARRLVLICSHHDPPPKCAALALLDPTREALCRTSQIEHDTHRGAGLCKIKKRSTVGGPCLQRLSPPPPAAPAACPAASKLQRRRQLPGPGGGGGDALEGAEGGRAELRAPALRRVGATHSTRGGPCSSPSRQPRRAQVGRSSGSPPLQ